MTKNTSNCKTLQKLSMRLRIYRFTNFSVIILWITICLESNPALRGFVLSMESTFWENRTKLHEATNMFLQFDDANFNEEDYIDSYDTWIKHGISSSGHPSYISQLRTINDNFNRNETSRISEDDQEEISLFLNLVNEYEDIKSDILSKINFIKNGSKYYNSHPFLSQSGSDDSAQNMTNTGFLSPLNEDVNMTQWSPYLIPGYIEAWNKSSQFNSINFSLKTTNKSEKYNSMNLKDVLLTFLRNHSEPSEVWSKFMEQKRKQTSNDG